VLAIHIILVRSCRRVTSKAFYRMRPASANFTVLVRECGLLALTVGIVWVRILKLGLTMILYIGRVDTPFLHSQGGRVGGLRIDREPYMFQIDILQHEVRVCWQSAYDRVYLFFTPFRLTFFAGAQASVH
jgi:hypothetical protein